MANVKVSAMTFPYPLGKIKPGGTSACVPLTTNVQPTEENGRHRNHFNFIGIRAWGGDGTTTGNSGVIYVCNSAAAPDTTNFTNVIDVLSPGEYWPRGVPNAANVYDISALFIGAENANDFAIANIFEY